MTARTLPSFVAFTGADDAKDCPGMVQLSRKYPIEWGLLIDRQKAGGPLFPSVEHIERFRKLGLRLCAHVCGSLASEIANGSEPTLDLGGFSRIQVNHGRGGADAEVVANVARFASIHGVRGILQCSGSSFPQHATSVDWLFDVSFGKGVPATKFPAIWFDHPLCGLSSGINPANVRAKIEHQFDVRPGVAYWIDMESGVRSDGAFDLQLCEAVCRAVYG